MYSNDPHEQATTLDDTFSDANVQTAGLLPGYSDWVDFAEGSIDEEELDHHWAAEQEENDRLIASQVVQMSSDELCAVLRDSTTPEEIKAAARVEAVRRINELMSGLSRKSA